MAVKYVIDDTTMTEIADPLRELSGRTDELTPAEMAQAGEEAVAEVQTQAGLIEQIATELQGKAADGGAGGVAEKISVILSSEVEGMACKYFDGSDYKFIDLPYFDPVTIEPVANSVIFFGLKENDYINWYVEVWPNYGVVENLTGNLWWNGREACHNALLVRFECEIHIYEYTGGLEE